MISCPTGAGKTTLLSQIFRRCKKVSWGGPLLLFGNIHRPELLTRIEKRISSGSASKTILLLDGVDEGIYTHEELMLELKDRLGKLSGFLKVIFAVREQVFNSGQEEAALATDNQGAVIIRLGHLTEDGCEKIILNRLKADDPLDLKAPTQAGVLAGYITKAKLDFLTNPFVLSVISVDKKNEHKLNIDKKKPDAYEKIWELLKDTVTEWHGRERDKSVAFRHNALGDLFTFLKFCEDLALAMLRNEGFSATLSHLGRPEDLEQLAGARSLLKRMDGKLGEASRFAFAHEIFLEYFIGRRLQELHDQKLKAEEADLPNLRSCPNACRRELRRRWGLVAKPAALPANASHEAVSAWLGAWLQFLQGLSPNTAMQDYLQKELHEAPGLYAELTPFENFTLTGKLFRQTELRPLWPYLGGYIRHLQLSTTAVGTDSTDQHIGRGRELASFRSYAKLVSLELAYWDLDDQDLLDNLAPGITSLEEIDLAGTNLRGPGLARFSGCAGIKLLWLGYTQVSDDALLGYFMGRSSIKALNLASTQVQGEGLAAFQGAEALYLLHLQYTGVGDAHLQYFTGFRHLKDLNLSATQVTDSGLGLLREAALLERLDVYGCEGITDACLAGGEYANIKDVWIRHSGITSLQAFLASESLASISVVEGQIPEEELAELEARGVEVFVREVDDPPFMDFPDLPIAPTHRGVLDYESQVKPLLKAWKKHIGVPPATPR